MRHTEIIPLLSAVDAAVSTFRQTVSCETWESYKVGKSVMERRGGELAIEVGVPSTLTSNHDKLTLDTKVERVVETLRPVFGALEAYLPGHIIRYDYDPSSQKHKLTLDDREVLEAVAKSWTVHLPLLQRVLGGTGAGKTWLVDTQMAFDQRGLSAEQLVKAPDLANAILRHRFFSSTLGERKSDHLSSLKVWAATWSEPHPLVAAATTPIATGAIEEAWENLQSRLERQWPWPTRPNLTASVVSGEIDLRMSGDVHLMVAPEDEKRHKAAITRASIELETFVEKIIRMAPNTDFTVQIGNLGNDIGWRAEFHTNAERVSTAAMISHLILQSEKRGTAPNRLFAVVDGSAVSLRLARDATEAKAKISNGIGPVKTLPMIPATLDEIAKAEADATRLWMERRHAPRGKTKAA